MPPPATITRRDARGTRPANGAVATSAPILSTSRRVGSDGCRISSAIGAPRETSGMLTAGRTAVKGGCGADLQVLHRAVGGGPLAVGVAHVAPTFRSATGPGAVGRWPWAFHVWRRPSGLHRAVGGGP